MIPFSASTMNPVACEVDFHSVSNALGLSILMLTMEEDTFSIVFDHVSSSALKLLRHERENRIINNFDECILYPRIEVLIYQYTSASYSPDTWVYKMNLDHRNRGKFRLPYF